MLDSERYAPLDSRSNSKDPKEKKYNRSIFSK